MLDILSDKTESKELKIVSKSFIIDIYFYIGMLIHTPTSKLS